MNTKNIQTFLMVSAAFFAMSAPVRSGSANTLADVAALTARVAPVRIAAERGASSSEADAQERHS